MSATVPDERVEAAPQASAVDTHVAVPRTAGWALLDWVAANRLFCLALACAAALRVLVAVAYAPAIEFFGDSYNYLDAARHVPQVDSWHPTVYPTVIRIVSVTNSLAVLTTLQHLAGLVTAVLVYRLVRGFGAGSVGGTVASLPVLFDAYQVNIEQYVLSEALFTLLLVVALRACARVTSRLTTSSATWAGLLLAALTLTRTVGVVVFAAALVYLLLSRVGWWRAGVVVVAFAVPVLGYALAFRATYGVTGLQAYGGRYSYGMVAPYVDCHELRLPREERVLCPRLPTYARPGLNQYVWDASPYRRLTGDALHRSAVAGRFAHTVMLHQPRATVSTIVHNLAHYFGAGRVTSVRDWFVGSWQFLLPERSPAWHVEPAYFGYGTQPAKGHGHIVVGLAQPLRRYQALMFAPGPLLLLCALLAAGALVLRGSRDPPRLLAALLAAVGVGLLLAPAASAGFDWRYLLPAQAVLAPAGVIAFGVLRSRLPRRVPHGVVPGVATALVVAGLASNLVAPSVYAASRLRVRLTAAAPAALPIGASLRVHVGRPTVSELTCTSGPDGSRWRMLAAFPVAASFRSGPRVLVQPTNFDVAGYEGTDGPSALQDRLGQLLPDVLLGPRYRHVAGTLFFYLTRPAGRLDYVDPRGAGAAGWSFRVDPRAGDRARMGRRCIPRTTWTAGESVRTLQILRLPPFTELASQRITYALTWNSARASTFDLRWRQGSAQAGFAAWQYPPAWQRTTATSQTLVNLAAGDTYCFSVRVRDRRGVATAWSEPRCTMKLSDDTTLAPSPQWRLFVHRAGFYLGSFSQTTAPGATLTTVGTYSRIGLVAYHCPACGVLQVYSGKRLVRSLDLASAPGRAGLFAWISPLFAPARSGPVALRVATRGRPVIVDAFGLQR